MSAMKTIDTTPIDTDEGLLSSALVFFLIVEESRLLFKVSL